MTVKSTAALMTLRALVGGGADVDTPEARRAAIAAVAAIADPAEKDRLLSFIEADMAAIILAECSDGDVEAERLELLTRLSLVESAGRRR